MHVNAGEKFPDLGSLSSAATAAIIAVKEFNATPEYAAEKMNAPLEKVLESLSQKNNIENVKILF